MPWNVQKREGKFCVVKEADGSTEACHVSRAEAERHMRALYTMERTCVEVEFTGLGTKNLLVAETITERAFGLQDLEFSSLKERGVDGMLFVYPVTTNTAFHAVDVKFDFLIAFFSATGKLVDWKKMKKGQGSHRSRRNFKYVAELIDQDSLPETTSIVVPDSLWI